VAEALLAVHLFLGYYSRSMTEDASSERKSPGEAPIDLAPVKTEHFESSYRIYTSMRADGLNSLTIITKLSPHESNPDRARSMSLLPRGWSLRRGLKDTRATVHAHVISRTCLKQLASLLLSRHMGLKVAPAISCPCA